MATSGRMQGNAFDGSNYFYIQWQLVFQDVAGNFSRVNWQAGWHFEGSVTDRQLDNGLAVLDGNVRWSVPGRVRNYAGNFTPRDEQVVAATIDVAHGGVGNASLVVSGGLTGFSGARSEGSAAWDLPVIPRQPTAPGTPTFSGVGPASALVSWTAPANPGAGLTQRQVQVARDSGFASLVADSTAAWGTTFNVSGLSKGTIYFARVRAASSAGFGPFSGTGAFATLQTVPGPPAAPVMSAVTTTSATATWTPPPDNGGTPIAGYHVQRATNAAFTTDVVQVTTTTLTASLTGLSPAAPYWVRVRAINGQGNGVWSPAAVVATLTNVFVGNGTAWVPARMFVGNGTTWAPARVHVGTGTVWT